MNLVSTVLNVQCICMSLRNCEEQNPVCSGETLKVIYYAGFSLA
jgi:hypothetical protein